MVRVCLVTVCSSTYGNDKDDNGAINLECSNDRNDIQRWCNFSTLRKRKSKVKKIFCKFSLYI